jgi:hypothetical protein
MGSKLRGNRRWPWGGESRQNTSLGGCRNLGNMEEQHTAKHRMFLNLQLSSWFFEPDRRSGASKATQERGPWSNLESQDNYSCPGLNCTENDARNLVSGKAPNDLQTNTHDTGH